MRRKFRAATTAGTAMLLFTVALNFGDSTAAQTELEGDAKAGEAKAVTCAACHGQKGISSNTLWPNLAGQQEGYLAKAIKDYRDGQRTEVTMDPFVSTLTDQDAADLAAYFAGLSACP